MITTVDDPVSGSAFGGGLGDRAGRRAHSTPEPDGRPLPENEPVPEEVPEPDPSPVREPDPLPHQMPIKTARQSRAKETDGN